MFWRFHHGNYSISSTYLVFVCKCLPNWERDVWSVPAPVGNNSPIVSTWGLCFFMYGGNNIFPDIKKFLFNICIHASNKPPGLEHLRSTIQNTVMIPWAAPPWLRQRGGNGVHYTLSINSTSSWNMWAFNLMRSLMSSNKRIHHIRFLIFHWAFELASCLTPAWTPGFGIGGCCGDVFQFFISSRLLLDQCLRRASSARASVIFGFVHSCTSVFVEVVQHVILSYLLAVGPSRCRWKTACFNPSFSQTGGCLNQQVRERWCSPSVEATHGLQVYISYWAIGRERERAEGSYLCTAASSRGMQASRVNHYKWNI